jgi:hypothetical protein
MVAIDTWHRWVAECEGWHACKKGVARDADPFAPEAWLRGWDDAAGATCDYVAIDEELRYQQLDAEYRENMDIGREESLQPFIY